LTSFWSFRETTTGEREPSPDDYPLLGRAAVQKRFGFDVLTVTDGSDSYLGMVEFFSPVRDNAGVRKGMLRIEL